LPDFARHRFRDNWRPLISIADMLGVGKEARDVASIFAQSHAEEYPAVTLLRDVRDIFNSEFADRMTSAEIVGHLHQIEASPWMDWSGTNNDQQAKPITQSGVAKLLRPFKIKPRSAWPKGKPRSESKSARYYFRDDFEKAWSRYGDQAAPSSQREDRLRLAS
jgi:hypothetical protein